MNQNTIPVTRVEGHDGLLSVAEHDKKCTAAQDIVKGITTEFGVRLDGLERQFDEHRIRFDTIEQTMIENTAALKAQSDFTHELIDILRSAKGFFRVAGWVGSGLKWALGVATGIAAFWAALKVGRS